MKESQLRYNNWDFSDKFEIYIFDNADLYRHFITFIYFWTE